jgi:hypothetical protein
LSVIETFALSDPVFEGVNTVLMAQDAPGANEGPQTEVARKSAAFVPLRLIPLIVNNAVPVLLRVAVIFAVANPRVCDPKERLPGVI